LLPSLSEVNPYKVRFDCALGKYALASFAPIVRRRKPLPTNMCSFDLRFQTETGHRVVGGPQSPLAHSQQWAHIATMLKQPVSF